MSSFGDFISLSDPCDVPTAKIIGREVKLTVLLLVLLFSSPVLKAAVNSSDCLLFVVCPFVNFSHFHLLKNH